MHLMSRFSTFTSKLSWLWGTLLQTTECKSLSFFTTCSQSDCRAKTISDASYTKVCVLVLQTDIKTIGLYNTDPQLLCLFSSSVHTRRGRGCVSTRARERDGHSPRTCLSLTRLKHKLLWSSGRSTFHAH